MTSEETIADKLAWKVIGGVAVAGAAFVAKKALDGGWKAATGNPPPTNPEHPDVAWREAIGFALLSGAVIGLAQLVAARNAAKIWRTRKGSLPPGLRDVG
jgi:hypothetical protein